MTIDKVKILLFNRGDHSFLAERFARDCAKVWSFTPILGRQPRSRDDQIDSGIKGVETVDDFDKYAEKADLIVFPGEFEGEQCDKWRKRGKRVFGSGLNAEIEINKILFLDTLKKVGLPIIKTYLAHGLDDAIKYLTGKTDKWIKGVYNRGDFDSQHFQTMETFMPWFTYQRQKLGLGVSETIELLIQDAFPCVIESGWDGYVIGDKMSKTGTIGYEVKDKTYIYKVVDQCPKILDDVNKKMRTAFTNYFGAYSTEVRINDKGESRFTDLTARLGSPPTEGICETYTTFTQDVFDVADGKEPQMKAPLKYGSMINLISSWNEKHEICVQFPKELEKNIKLRHSYKHKGNRYCVPNDSSGYFGVVSAQSNNLKDAIKKCNEMAKQVVCLDLEYSEIDLDKAEELIKGGRQHGINVGA